MKAYEYILSKQTQWALKWGIELIGSKGNRGRPAYTKEVDQNLFEPLADKVRQSFNKADGHEIKTKMRAVHSSSALSVNIFQYWRKNNQAHVIAAACGFCEKGSEVSKEIIFEDKKYKIDNHFQYPPNIDVVFENSDSSENERFAVECKFSEPYSPWGHRGLDNKYTSLGFLWEDIPHLYKLSDEFLCPVDKKFKYLYAAQLIKHVLGLKKKLGINGFRLLYLYYDGLGEEGATHRREIEVLSEAMIADGVKFHSMTYQELITQLANDYRTEEHKKYINYLTERYL